MPQRDEAYSETDTRSKLIDPALRERDWTEDLVRREKTQGRIIKTDRGIRRGRAQADYLLSLPSPHEGRRPIPVALIEAKKNTASPGAGLEQAKAYARECERFNVPFIYSSNGYKFVEYDSTTGKESQPQVMALFPTPTDLLARYEDYIGLSLQDDAAKPLAISSDRGGRRYYQDAAIRATLERLAFQEKSGDPKRVLLNLATGAGKTFIAVNLLKQIHDAGKLRRALFLCDRDALRQQAFAQFQQEFGRDVEIVENMGDGENRAQNARIHIATYQTLGVKVDEEDGRNFAVENYPPDHFSHIIIDECHRSARNDWAEILNDNKNAAHIGLTATPKQIKGDSEEGEIDRQVSLNNIQHFGEPVYVYDLAQGAEDGYLALCEIHQSRINLDDTGLTIDEVMEHAPTNYCTGELLTKEELQELYEKNDYENMIMLPDRVHLMCADLFQKLIANGADGDPQQKTIIFCARRQHAEMVTRELNNMYARWCEDNSKDRASPYAFVCMSGQGDEQLAEFRSEDNHHFVAATVDLLSTGVDIPAVRNIVFFRYMKSPIQVQQMMGRGARIDETRDKFSFTVYDYTNATDLLEKEDWNPPGGGSSGGGGSGGEGGDERDLPPPLATVEGLEVHISAGGSYIVERDDESGTIRRMNAEEYRAKMMREVLQHIETLDDLRAVWIDPQKRGELARQLRANGISIRAMAKMLGMQEYDDYDIIADSSYGAMPIKRKQRAEAFLYKNAEWLQKLPQPTAEVIKAFVQKFAENGIEELESATLFKTPDVRKAGGVEALNQASNEPQELLDETKRRLFVA